MNPVTFNEEMLQLMDKAEAKDKDILRSYCESPLIQFDEPTEQGFDCKQFPDAFFQNQCPRLPFNIFRVSGFYHYLGAGFMRFKAWVKQTSLKTSSPGFILAIKIEETEEGNVREVAGTPGVFFISANYTNTTGSNGLPVIAWQHQLVDPKSGITNYNPELQTDQLWSISGEWIQKLSIDFYNPHLFLCKRHPKLPKGKSVNWIKQREHFVLLHKSHAANSVESIGKKTIHDVSEKNRVSHSRRAHFRLLSSAKFKHKRGQRVWVSSTWVGPKEWTDRSGQIYKIVDRKTQ